MNKSKKETPLPSKIKIRISKGISGCYLAEFLEYGIHTESETLSGLDFMINDLIYAYFNVPKKYWGKIWYIKSEMKPKPQIDLKGLLLYRQFVTPNTKFIFK